MLRSAVLTLLAAVTFGAAQTGNAALIRFDAELLGANEIPAVATPGTGSATIFVDTVLRVMTIEADFSGLLGVTTAAHIHCCAVQPANVGVATQVPSFMGFPLGVSAGTYDHVFDMNDSGFYNPAFLTAHGGTEGAFNFLLAGMIAERSYFNIHSSLFGGGEIRGILLVPEPGVLALLGLAVIGLVAVRRGSHPA